MNKYDFSEYTQDNFDKFFEEFNVEKISSLTIDQQRDLKESIAVELENRISILEKTQFDINELYLKENELTNDVNNLGKIEARGDYDKDGLATKLRIQAEEARIEIIKQRRELEQKCKEASAVIELLQENLKANKYSEQKKKINDIKFKLRSTPQKICSANLSFLKMIRSKGKNKYENLFKNLNEKMQNSENRMESLEQEKLDIITDKENTSAFERYKTENVVSKQQRKEYKKFKRYAAGATILTKLRGSAVRSIDVPIEFYNKLNQNYENKLKVA